MRMRLSLILLLFAAGGLLLLRGAQADVPPVLSYQGRLLDTEGQPLKGEVEITFRLYDRAEGGEVLWEESQPVSLEDGVFEVLLGRELPLDTRVFDAPERWLSVEVEGGGELLPRQPLSSVGYAFRVGSVDGATGGAIQGDLDLGGALRLPEGIRLETVAGALQVVAGASTVTIGTDGTVRIEANSVEVQSAGDLRLSGTNVDIRATATLNLEGGVGANLRSSAITNVQGSLVKLN